MSITLPYTIESITGEKLTFLRIIIKDGIEYLEADNEIQPNADHLCMFTITVIECLTVVSGKLGYRELMVKNMLGLGETASI